ncbi:hypothetical protein FKM82_014479 [Ascaphus truei]|uniref:large ribosomal subunit protein mL43 isoform X2 n=1 Tax=Ascaphus truei TaxID=8439 RepID=UPI003F59148C
MTARGTANRFLQSVLRNGLGREFIEDKALDFAKKNPSIVLYVNCKRYSGPKLVAEYLNGTVREEALNNKTGEEIVQLMQKMANQSGLDIVRIRKNYHTDSPSIQGQWHPFTNKPPSLTLKTFETVNQQTKATA